MSAHTDHLLSTNKHMLCIAGGTQRLPLDTAWSILMTHAHTPLRTIMPNRAYRMRAQAFGAWRRLQKIIYFLQSPRGCPWDRKQTPHSLRAHLIEETYEVIDAIDRGATADIIEEIGDLLLVIILIINSYERKNMLNQQMVYRALRKKLIRRHPHIFNKRPTQHIRDAARDGDTSVWEAVKMSEKKNNHGAPPTHSEERAATISKIYSAIQLHTSRKQRKKIDDTRHGYTQSVSILKERIDALIGAPIEDTHTMHRVYGELLLETVTLAQQIDINPLLSIRALLHAKQ